METRIIDTSTIEGLLAREKDCEELVQEILDSDAEIEDQEYALILSDCDRCGISERDLWQTMALYRKAGVVSEKGTYPLELGDGLGEKLRKRTLTLIGKLPHESLDEFRGLVAFTASFLTRVQFVCDLVVYLFAEREKGVEREQTDKRVYTQFFVEKLMWELDMISQISDTKTLQELNEEYVGWLSERIIDGEVLI
jgi:hypothetical protein